MFIIRRLKVYFFSCAWYLRNYILSFGRKFPVEFSKEDKELFLFVRRNNFSMASNERLFSTILACKYAVENKIKGDFVECGVWRGGNAIIAASIFKRYSENKKVYLFDTFGGMTEPTLFDKKASSGEGALNEYNDCQKKDHNEWCFASLEDVKKNFMKAGLLDENIIFIKGDVLETLEIASNFPDSIAVLRLDTDWYESTRKELEVLYPRLADKGVLIIDDYGYWEGARKAVDEYFDQQVIKPLLQYVDSTGRCGVKNTI